MLVSDKDEVLVLLADKLGCDKKQVEFIFRRRPLSRKRRLAEKRDLEIPRWG